MTVCHGCNQPLEPLALFRTYHTGCDPQGRVAMLERALEEMTAAAIYQCGSHAKNASARVREIADERFKAALDAARAALAYKPAQMRGREG